MKKGELGYIRRRKKKQLLFSIFLFTLAIGIFILGCYLNKGAKNNVFSIGAVLMILPAAKVFVGFIVLCPYQSADETKYHEAGSAAAGRMRLLTDLVITSSEKVMNLDFAVVAQGYLIGVIGKQKQDAGYIETFLSRMLKNNGHNLQVKIFRDYKQFLNRIGTIPDDGGDSSIQEVVDLFMTCVY